MTAQPGFVVGQPLIEHPVEGTGAVNQSIFQGLLGSMFSLHQPGNRRFSLHEIARFLTDGVSQGKRADQAQLLLNVGDIGGISDHWGGVGARAVAFAGAEGFCTFQAGDGTPPRL